MRKLFVTLIASLLTCSSAFAFWPEALDSCFEVGLGYRNDSLKWKESADTFIGTAPVEVGSRVKWRNLNIWQVEAKGKYVTCDDIYLRGSADYGWITGGRVKHREFVEFDGDVTVTDSDLLSGFDDSTSRHTRGHVYDVTLALGYQFRMCDDAFSIAPLFGYSWHGQHLDFHFGDDSTTGTYTSSYDSGSYEDSTRYHTRWRGWLIGFDLDYQFCCDWNVFFTYEFHWDHYYAKSHNHFDSTFLEGFRHHSDRAYGQVVELGTKWAWCDCWTLGLTGKFQWWRAHHGKAKALISDVSVGDISTRCYDVRPLNHVDWCSASITVDVGFIF